MGQGRRNEERITLRLQMLLKAIETGDKVKGLRVFRLVERSGFIVAEPSPIATGKNNNGRPRLESGDCRHRFVEHGLSRRPYGRWLKPASRSPMRSSLTYRPWAGNTLL